jgi:hypothetical protein
VISLWLACDEARTAGRDHRRGSPRDLVQTYPVVGRTWEYSDSRYRYPKTSSNCVLGSARPASANFTAD